MQTKIGLPPLVQEALSETDYSFNEDLSVPQMSWLLTESCLSGGKRFRPTLCYLMSGVIGFPLKQAKVYARASELVHSASLAHDDVIDFAGTRRGRPTLNALAENKRAVLGGDLLLARVMTELVPVAPRIVIIELSRAIEELVQGEWLQLEATGIADITSAHLERVSRLKTASLIRWCCSAPAYSLAEVNPALIDACKTLGNCIGLAFQMVDDIVDFEGGSGKSFAKDLDEGLINWVSLEILNHDFALASRMRKEAVENWRELFMENTANFSKAQSTIRLRALSQIETAKNQLKWIATFGASDLAQKNYLDALMTALDAIGARTC